MMLVATSLKACFPNASSVDAEQVLLRALVSHGGCSCTDESCCKRKFGGSYLLVNAEF